MSNFQSEMIEILLPLKEAIKLTPNRAQYLFDQHIDKINECIKRRFSLQEIMNYLYSENEKIPTFYYFKNMLQRARKKHNKTINNASETEKQNSIIVKEEILPQQEKENNKPENRNLLDQLIAKESTNKREHFHDPSSSGSLEELVQSFRGNKK